MFNALALIALPLFAASSAAPSVDAAFKGLVAQVEDDIGKGPDRLLKTIRTKGCTTRLIAKGKTWTVNWSKAEAVILEDTFIFISAPPRVKLAIVGDAGQPDQRAKLQTLHTAMMAKAKTCAKR
jgi:hypothetical protein